MGAIMEKTSGNFWKVWGQTNALYTEWCTERNYNPYPVCLSCTQLTVTSRSRKNKSQTAPGFLSRRSQQLCVG